MKTTIHGRGPVEDKTQPGTGAADLVCIDVDGDKLDGFGEHVATVDVVRSDGKVARLFVRVYTDCDGKVWGRISTPRKSKNTDRDVCAVWRGDYYR